jgi:hypothetical protein
LSANKQPTFQKVFGKIPCESRTGNSFVEPGILFVEPGNFKCENGKSAPIQRPLLQSKIRPSRKCAVRSQQRRQPQSRCQYDISVSSSTMALPDNDSAALATICWLIPPGVATIEDAGFEKHVENLCVRCGRRQVETSAIGLEQPPQERSRRKSPCFSQNCRERQVRTGLHPVRRIPAILPWQVICVRSGLQGRRTSQPC